MKSALLFIFILSLTIAGLSAQGQVTFQERAYRLDSKYKFMQTSDRDRQGNVVMGGLIRPGSADLHNSMVMLIKPNTDTLWTQRGPDVADYSIYPGVKFRANGGFAFATSIKKSYTMPAPADNWDGVLQKISPTGSLLMNKPFNPANDGNVIVKFLTMPDKGYLISGGGGIGAGFPWAFSLTRTDSAGAVLWQRNHTQVAPDGLSYMEHAGNGNTIMAGAIRRPYQSTYVYKIKFFLLNANGDSLRANRLNLTQPDRNELMTAGSDQSLLALTGGGFLITGAVDTANSTPGSYSTLGFIVKVDANLQFVWKYIYRPQGSMANGVYFTKAKELKDGSIVVMGQSDAILGTSAVNGFQLYRFSSTGNLMATYPFTSSLYPHIVVNTLEALPDSSFMIGGQCRTATQTGFYFARVKIPNLPAGRPSLIQLLGTEEDLITASTALGAAYPNPTAAETIIPYSLPKNYGKANIIIREIATGREIKKYELKRNESSLKVDLSNFSNGLYLYSLIVDDKPVAQKKLSVMR